MGDERGSAGGKRDPSKGRDAGSARAAVSVTALAG
jgi:hypothetical protein